MYDSLCLLCLDKRSPVKRHWYNNNVYRFSGLHQRVKSPGCNISRQRVRVDKRLHRFVGTWHPAAELVLSCQHVLLSEFHYRCLLYRCCLPMCNSIPVFTNKIVTCLKDNGLKIEEARDNFVSIIVFNLLDV